MGDTTDATTGGPDILPVAYQPPRLRITASYEPDNGRQPTGVEIEVFNDAPLTPAVIHQIVTGLAGVISGAATSPFSTAGTPATTTVRTVNAAKFDLTTGIGATSGGGTS
jgi:hypothetical protein